MKTQKNITKSELFFSAIRRADIASVERFLSQGVDWEASGEDNETPLYLAVQTGKWKLIRLLVRQGVDALEVFEYSPSPLNWALETGQTDLARYLFREAHKAGVGELWGIAALRFDARRGALDSVQWLVNHGVNLLSKENGFPVLYYAAQSGNLALMKYLIEEHREDFQQTDYLQDGNLLLYAAQSGSLEMVQWLAETLHLSVYFKDNRDCTLLHFAARAGSRELVEWLVKEKKIDVNAETNYAPYETLNLCPIHEAAAGKHWDIVRWLIEQGADVNADSGWVYKDFQVILTAIMHGDLEMTQWLLCHGAKQSKDKLLKFASEQHQPEILHWLENQPLDSQTES